MSMSLFDAPGRQEPRSVTLVRLAGEIARSAATIGPVAVEGEVHRPTVSRGGWTFFTLRDRAAQISVTVPRTNARRCRVVAGERVCVVGALEWAPDRGQLQLVAQEVTPVGAGAVAALIAETRTRLVADGLVGRPGRRLPRLPALIGVVCGADAAVRKDIESVVAARFPGYPVSFEETTVSGPGAQVSIVDALRAVASRPAVDVVILARGGGDATALLPWSSEEVCRAVAACPVPVVSAIGHDGDRPLCDEVADRRCGTPSIAAALVVPDRRELQAGLDAVVAGAARALSLRVDASSRRLAACEPVVALRRGVEGAEARLARDRDRLLSAHPRHQLRLCGARLGALDWRRPVRERVARAGGRLEAEGRHLRALSPQRTLERGYAVVTSLRGQVVRQSGQVGVGEQVTVQLAAGGFEATVDRVTGGRDA
jgi:exodeoxyribonuclease VII large subunit